MLKKGILYSLLFIFTIILFIGLSNLWITQSTVNKVFSEVNSIPKNDVALVLGTNPLIAKRYINPYFTYRIDAAEKLYQAGKVKHFIVSGDNGRKSYDEPTAMRDSLIARGIPSESITLDYAGFRTLDSVIRSKAIFQQEKLTIISQEFHNYRALAIAKRHGIDAIAFNADKPYPSITTKPEYREYIARCKAVVDLYILNKQPKFLGEKIDIPLASN